LGFGGAESLALSGFPTFTFADGAAHLGVDQAITKASKRIVKPEFSVLTDISDAADGLTNALPQVGRLWRANDDGLSQFGRRFCRLAELRAGVQFRCAAWEPS
jgi:hypothetical protein